MSLKALAIISNNTLSSLEKFETGESALLAPLKPIDEVGDDVEDPYESPKPLNQWFFLRVVFLRLLVGTYTIIFHNIFSYTSEPAAISLLRTNSEFAL